MPECVFLGRSRMLRAVNRGVYIEQAGICLRASAKTAELRAAEIKAAVIKPAEIKTAKIKITKIEILALGAGAFLTVLCSGSAAQAQCTSSVNGLNAAAPVVAQAANMAVANVSAS